MQRDDTAFIKLENADLAQALLASKRKPLHKPFIKDTVILVKLRHRSTELLREKMQKLVSWSSRTHSSMLNQRASIQTTL